MSASKKIVLLAAMTSLAALSAQAADITLLNPSSSLIHPYFRSNCWDPSISTAKPNEWVFFGGVLSHSQFTWPAFETLLRPGCKRPDVSFTFALDGEAAPTGHGNRERTTRLEFDATVPVYTLTVTDVPELTSVTPKGYRDDDNDD